MDLTIYLNNYFGGIRFECSFTWPWQDELRDAVLLIFANKQDLPNAMNAADITDKLGLHSLRQRHWYDIADIWLHAKLFLPCCFTPISVRIFCSETVAVLVGSIDKLLRPWLVPISRVTYKSRHFVGPVWLQ
jgi:hypothetical protein